jgi:hypothetical protein
VFLHVLLERRDHAHGEAHAVLQRPAVLIRAEIGQGREEGERQVAVRAVELDRVEARRGRTPGGLPVAPDDRLDLLDAQLVGYVPAGLRARHGRRRDRLEAAHRPRGVAPGVVELDADPGAVSVRDLRQVAEALDAEVLMQTELVRAAAPYGVDEGGLDIDPAHASACACLVVRLRALGDRAVRVSEVALHRGHDDAVLDRHPPYLDWREEVLKLRNWISSSATIMSSIHACCSAAFPEGHARLLADRWSS